MKTAYHIIFTLLITVASAGLGWSAAELRNNGSSEPANSDYVVYRCEVSLPGPGRWELAGDLNESVATAFGISQLKLLSEQQDQLRQISEREVAHGDEVYIIQDDLEAYYNRMHDGKFRTVLQEMKSTQVVSNLQEIAKMIADNYHGHSIAQAEYWADTLDRWAEQLVGPG